MYDNFESSCTLTDLHHETLREGVGLGPVDLYHIFDLLPTYGAEWVEFLSDCLGALEAHAHVSAGVEDGVDWPLVAHVTLIALVVGDGVTD